MSIDPTWLAALAAKYEVPGVSVGVLKDGVLHQAVAGTLNANLGTPVTEDSIFQIGSITKIWTTTLLMLLSESGELDLDAPVRKYIPELELSDEDVAAEIKVWQLLNHTSGLPGDWFPDTGPGPDCLEKYIPLLKTLELEIPLGSGYSYSNCAFTIAGRVIEVVTGKVFDDVLQELICKPLGLTRTCTLASQAILHSVAVGHLGLGAKQIVTPQWDLPRACGPAGAIATNTAELLAFAATHMPQPTMELLTPASVERMQTATVRMPGGALSRGEIGLGWWLGGWGETRTMGHSGATIGQSALLRMFPDHGLAVAILTNGGDSGCFRDEVIARLVSDFAGISAPAPIEPREGVSPSTGIGGTYRSNGQELIVTEGPDAVTMSMRDLDEIEELAGGGVAQIVTLVPHAQDAFIFKTESSAAWLPVLFLRDETSAVTYIHLGSRSAKRRDG